MLKRIITLVVVATVLVVLAAAVCAKTYVSLNGEFYITYPDDWEQIDYNTVDLFLSRSGADETMYEYDAVLAPSASSPFFTGDYLIVTVEKTGELSNQLIDSVLAEYADSFQKGIANMATDEFMADLKSNSPVYDADKKVMTVLNDIYQGQEIVKKNLIMVKFYEKGIASFYFYSPDSLFQSSKVLFEDIFESLSTENLQAAMPSEEVKVADIETDDEGRLKDSDSNLFLYLAVAVVICFILLGTYVRLKKK